MVIFILSTKGDTDNQEPTSVVEANQSSKVVSDEVGLGAIYADLLYPTSYSTSNFLFHIIFNSVV